LGRHRYMYYATGLPGWMRFGFSPGWIGRSPTGLGPCASYLMTGQWPMPWGAMPSGQAAPPGSPTVPAQSQGQGFVPPTFPSAPMGWYDPMAGIPKEQQVQMLEEQAKAVEEQLQDIKQRIEELKNEA
jgi:hypothetical protein